MIFTTAMLVAAAVAEVAPKIWDLIKKVEEFIPEAGMGKIKKQLVMAAILDDALAIAGSLLPGFNIEKVKPLLEKHLGGAIDAAVKILNSILYLQRTRLDPKDFSGESGKASVGLVASIAAIFCFSALGFLISLGLLISCGGSIFGTEALYSGTMAGQGESALFVQGVCYEAQECAGGEPLDQGLPDLIILGPDDSNVVECNGKEAGSCYDMESRSIVLPSNPNKEAVLTACLYDWSYQINGDPDFEKAGEPWTRGCNKPFRIVE